MPAEPSPEAASPVEPLYGVAGGPSSWGALPPSGGGASLKRGELSLPHVPATATEGPLRATTVFLDPTLSRGVFPWNGRARFPVKGEYVPTTTTANVALGALFQPSTLHELRQLGLFTKMDTPDTAHQLNAEVVVAVVAYTMTNTQPSCSGGGESDRILNILKEAMDLPQAARLKEALDKDIASLQNYVVFGLVQTASVLAGHKVVSIRWVPKLRRTVPTRVDPSCKDFSRSLASIAVAASFPSAGSRVST